jgi:hypothetical protein
MSVHIYMLQNAAHRLWFDSGYSLAFTTCSVASWFRTRHVHHMHSSVVFSDCNAQGKLIEKNSRLWWERREATKATIWTMSSSRWSVFHSHCVVYHTYVTSMSVHAPLNVSKVLLYVSLSVCAHEKHSCTKRRVHMNTSTVYFRSAYLHYWTILLCVNVHCLTCAHVWSQLFQLFDENHDGLISAVEMSHVMGMLGRQMSLRRATSIVTKNSKGI